MRKTKDYKWGSTDNDLPLSPDEIIKMYNEGRGMAQIAGIIGTSYWYVHKCLSLHGVLIRKSEDRCVELSFTPSQRSAFEGMMLGDAHIVRPGSLTSRFCSSSCNRDLTEYYMDALGVDRERLFYRSPRKPTHKVQCEFRTISSPTYKREYERWYPYGKKIVPEDVIVDKISSLFWYLGDGSLAHRETQKGSFNLIIAVCGFDNRSVEILREKLSIACGLPWKILSGTYDYPYMRLDSRYVVDFFDWMGPCPVESMKYRWPREDEIVIEKQKMDNRRMRERRALDMLKDRQSGMTHQEIADKNNLSRAYVYRICEYNGGVDASSTM